MTLPHFEIKIWGYQWHLMPMRVRVVLWDPEVPSWGPSWVPSWNIAQHTPVVILLRRRGTMSHDGIPQFKKERTL